MIDLVHDVQKTYRRLLRTFSFPGRREGLRDIAVKIDLDIPFPREVALLSMTLLDNESSFAVVPASKEEQTLWETWISQLTFSRPKPHKDAAFVFVDFRNPERDTLKKAIVRCQSGTFRDPHLGATLLVLGPSELRWTWIAARGPGISEPQQVFLPEGDWVEERRKKNQEFPRGIDLVFLDEEGGIISLPRTTELEPWRM